MVYQIYDLVKTSKEIEEGKIERIISMVVEVTRNTIRRNLFSLADKVPGTSIISIDYQQDIPEELDKKFEIRVGFYQYQKASQMQMIEREINQAIDNSSIGKFPKEE